MSETEATPVPQRRRMQLVAEQQIADSPSAPPVPPMQPSQVPQALTQELMARRAWRSSVIASLNVAAAILAARLILLLATVGAFALSWLAIQSAQPLQLGAVALYLAGVILPLVWLSGRR